MIKKLNHKVTPVVIQGLTVLVDQGGYNLTTLASKGKHDAKDRVLILLRTITIPGCIMFAAGYFYIFGRDHKALLPV